MEKKRICKKLMLPLLILPALLSYSIGEAHNVSNESTVVTTTRNPNRAVAASDTVKETYYGSVWNSTSIGSTLRQELEDQVRGKMGNYANQKYGDLSPKYATNILCNAYEDPDNSNNMLLYYTAESVAKGGNGNQNKEHVWPNSRGTGEGTGPCGDPWVIAPADSNENSGRGNNVFGTVSGSYDAGTAATDAKIEYRGIVARAMFYTATVYWHHPGKNTNPLELNDIVTYTAGQNYMGRISELLAWNLQYPVTQQEVLRNEYLFKVRSCRNPFVDDPTLACRIWKDTNTNTCTACKDAEKAVSNVTITSNGSAASSSTRLYFEDSLQLGSEVTGGSEVDTSVIWESSDTNVLTVSQTGLVQVVAGVTSGSATITATSTTDSTKKCSIVINLVSSAIAVSGLTIPGDNFELKIGKTQQLSAVVTPTDATDASVTWESSDETIVSVTAGGLVAAIKEGKATITAKSVSNNTILDTIEVTVTKQKDNKLVLILCLSIGGALLAIGLAVGIFFIVKKRHVE